MAGITLGGAVCSKTIGTKVKLKRLGDPKTHVYKETSLFGETVTTEITVASQFDMLPTWAQWGLVGFMVAMLLAALVVAYFH